MKKLIVLAASFALVATFAMTAAAADWNFYGSARVSTFWTSADLNVAGLSDADDFAQGLQGNARIGANVKVSDELSGRFEYGTGVNTRLLYGQWDFGGGKFLVGQTYSPLNMFYSGQVFGSDLGLLSYGGVYSGREAILQLQFGGFKVALINPSKKTADIGAVAVEADSTETTLPGIEASFGLSFDPVSLKVAGGYQTYEATWGTMTEDVESYMVALGAAVNLGIFYVKGDVYYGQNPGNLISVDAGSGWGANGLAAANPLEFVDNDTYGFIVVAGLKLNDMFGLEAGYGYVNSEFDASGSNENEAMAYYVQAPITLAPGVFVIPEVGFIDNCEDDFGADEHEVTYFGAKWQINF